MKQLLQVIVGVNNSGCNLIVDHVNARKRAQTQRFHGRIFSAAIGVAKNLTNALCGTELSVGRLMEAATDGTRLFSRRVYGVVANHQVISLIDAAQIFLTLHSGGFALATQLQKTGIKLISCTHKNLKEIKNTCYISQSDIVIKLKRSQAQKRTIKLLARILHSNRKLIDGRHNGWYRLQRNNVTINVD